MATKGWIKIEQLSSTANKAEVCWTKSNKVKQGW